ncbi:MAG: IS1380 family transposase [Acidobacteria bacterium]|nr:IS1380 family transposase [Acidobacteriota bacterium]
MCWRWATRTSNDHDTLRRDPLVAAVVGKLDPTGARRVRAADRGAALAGKSTLNQMELAGPDPSRDRYKKVRYDAAALDALLVALFIESHARPPRRIVLDVDATDDPLHGKQEGRFFHGYYRHFCYLPLYIFCGGAVLGARLRPANRDAAVGVVEELARVVGQLRRAWPDVSILLRSDSGFCREDLLAWCEAHGVDYLVGLAKNERLKRQVAPEMAGAGAACRASGEPARVFADFPYRTLTSWSRERRVVGKAEQLPGRSNPRFMVTSLPPSVCGARSLYEDLYCARGEWWTSLPTTEAWTSQSSPSTVSYTGGKRSSPGRCMWKERVRIHPRGADM